MRVTEGMTYASMRASINTAQSRALAASDVANSGKRVTKSSDDPTSYAKSMVYNRGLTQLDAMDRASSITKTDLTATDDALSDSETVFTRAKEIAVAGGNSTLTADQRAAYADEVAQLRSQLLANANTQVGGNYIFSGGQSSTPAFDSAGAYGGDSNVRTVAIGSSDSVSGNVLGTDAFKPSGGVDAFDVLSRLEASLRTGTANGTAATIPDLETASVQVTKARTGNALTLNKMETATSTRDAIRAALTTAKSEAVEADTVNSSLDLLRAQQALEGAISSAQRMISAMQNGLFS